MSGAITRRARPQAQPASSIGAIDVAAVRPTLWRRGSGGGAHGGANASADRRAERSTTPAASNRAECSPRAGTDQTAAEGALGRIVGVCPGGRGKEQSGADDADNDRWGFHLRMSSG